MGLLSASNLVAVYTIIIDPMIIAARIYVSKKEKGAEVFPEILFGAGFKSAPPATNSAHA